MRRCDLPPTCPPRYQLWILLRHLRVGVLTTRSPRGVLSSRPLVTRNPEHDVGRVLMFLVSADSLWMRDIASDAHVSLVYADLASEQFLAVSGAARVTQSLTAQQALWCAELHREFPGGPADPMLRLLEVDIEAARFQHGTLHQELTGEHFGEPAAGPRRGQGLDSAGYRSGNRIRKRVPVMPLST